LENIESWFGKKKKASRYLLCHISKGSAWDQDGCEKMNLDLEMQPTPNRLIDSNDEQEDCGNLKPRRLGMRKTTSSILSKKHKSIEYLQYNFLSNSI